MERGARDWTGLTDVFMRQILQAQERSERIDGRSTIGGQSSIQDDGGERSVKRLR